MKKTMLVCLVVAMMLSGCSSANNINTSDNSKATETSVQQVKNKYIMAGKIDADDQVNIASKISARVSEVLVDIGSNVNAGDTIIKLDTQDLQAQVDQAQAAVNTANASLTNAMNSTRPEQIAQAQAALDSANEAYEVAKKNYDRTKALVDAGGNTEQQLETAHQQLTAAESQQKSAQEQLNMLNNGATETSIDVYKAQVEQAEAALKTAQIVLNNGIITAPISGKVTVRNINAGEIASAGATLISISNPNALCVNAYAPLSITKDLKEGQTVINSKLNSQSNNVLIKITLSDPNGKLRPGMFAEVGLRS